MGPLRTDTDPMCMASHPGGIQVHISQTQILFLGGASSGSNVPGNTLSGNVGTMASWTKYTRIIGDSDK